MSQKIVQSQVRYLKYTVTGRHLLSLVGSGLTFEEIRAEVDPIGANRITGKCIANFLNGATRDNTGATPDTDEQIDVRRTQYLRLRELMYAEKEPPQSRPC